MVDKDLFLHDLSIVAILKNEGHYLKEWIDYHLLAGVDHFYLYDNESPDNQAEVIKPYVEAGLVDYFPLPGKVMQMLVYNDAVKRFKFQSRYMAFIDCDEFIHPKINQAGIVEVVDEILSQDPNAAGLGINWQIFGSNGQEKADYSRGVLERFTRRAPKDWYFMLHSQPVGGNPHVKTISNPRMISVANAHFPNLFEGKCSVNENGKIVPSYFNIPVTADKIVINHYFKKSREEYEKKVDRGKADRPNSRYSKTPDNFHNCNEEFDDGILKYRDERAKVYRPPDKSHTDERLLSALAKNLSPMILPIVPPNFYAGKMETFLTCRAVSTYLRGKFPNEERLKILENAALMAILKSASKMDLADARLFLRELPKLLRLPYPVVNDLRAVALQILPQIMTVMHLSNLWKDYAELDYIQDLLKIGG